MICPRCGQLNSDSAGQCSQCHYKFRPGYAFNDPANAMYPSFVQKSSHESKKSKRKNIVGYVLFILLLLVLILSVYSSFYDFW